METKIELVRILLERGEDTIREYLKQPLSDCSRAYYEGKKDGYSRALDLLNEDNIESLKIEL